MKKFLKIQDYMLKEIQNCLKLKMMEKAVAINLEDTNNNTEDMEEINSNMDLTEEDRGILHFEHPLTPIILPLVDLMEEIKVNHNSNSRISPLDLPILLNLHLQIKAQIISIGLCVKQNLVLFVLLYLLTNPL